MKENIKSQTRFGTPERNSYDSMGRITQISISGVGNFVYSYDGVGNVISESGPEGTISYSYDSIYQLTQANYPDGTVYTYSYDAAGNRTGDKDRTYTYNNLNQLISASDGTTYSYDANGNLIEKNENGNITQYEWNAYDKLKRVVKSDGSVIQYRYNAEGLREVKVREDGSEVRYLLDGLAVLCEYDGNLNILREYVPGISMKTNGNTYYYIYDRLGNVRYVLDESGSIVQSYTYSPFGQVHTESGSLSQPYMSVGGEFYYTEEDTGLKLLGQRWYDAETGRFISRDPIGEEGGLNLYVYVRNNVVNYTDPSGKSRCCDIEKVRKIIKDIIKAIAPDWKDIVYHSGKKGMEFSSCITVLRNLIRMQNYLRNNCPSGIEIPFSFNSLKTAYEFGLNCCKSSFFHLLNLFGASRDCLTIEWFRYKF